ncbi:unnamed protein product [Enterobius vermicularis]|uniref:WD_REPEATS_REGION domain-containing protein n=1 Tax=Enterobius vermicularis TaxID=51028 RepID=A0A0N4VQ49_ENTVE|nr:unnamed protein product [Enterobius vermicularis]
MAQDQEGVYKDGSFFSFNDYRLLASGSDDLHVKIWDLCGKEVHSFNSGHVNNIFSVQFLPSGQGKVILSAAGDRSVRMHSYTYSETSHVWYSDGRVKRLAVTAADPHLFWSASEDGIIREYDTRTCASTELLTFENKECKSLALNENRPEMLAVALNEAGVPLYDRRNVSRPLLTLIPAHIPLTDPMRSFKSLSVTHVGFNNVGNELIVNIGGEQIYIFNVFDKVEEPDALQSLKDILTKSVPSGKNGCLCRKPTARFKKLRERAKIHFGNQDYADAIDAYSTAIAECDRLWSKGRDSQESCAGDLCLLLSNRGASYLRRGWEGDIYACLLDTIRALKLDPDNIKAHYRIVKSLYELKQYEMAGEMLQLFKDRFPNDTSCGSLEKLLNEKRENSIKWVSNGTADYVQRLCGHCNTNTDIKEAVWFGGRDEYIAAGSDCGSLLVWERKSGVLVKAYEADKNILNCVQPHPSSCLLATSGLEHVIRFWDVLPEVGLHIFYKIHFTFLKFCWVKLR